VKISISVLIAAGTYSITAIFSLTSHFLVMIRLLFGKQRNPYASFQIYRYDDARTRHVPKPTNKEESQEMQPFTPQQHAHENVK